MLNNAGRLSANYFSLRTQTKPKLMMKTGICCTFGDYFVDKIVKLRDSVSDTLRLLSASVDSHLSFPPHHGLVLDMSFPVTAAEITRVLSSSPAKSSTMDIIPTSLLLRCKDVFSEIIAHLANLFFVEGNFRTLFKRALVTPLIKGQSLDKSVPFNYTPISNLNFVSKILERLFLSRFQPHILTSSNFSKYQSAYRPGCSTETALQLLLDNIYSTADDGRPTLLVSLDFSAAFDTNDHAVLHKCLNCSFGILGTVYSWLQSYLTGRTQSVRTVHSLISCYSISSQCSPRLCPLAATFFHLHFTCFYYCSVSAR